MIDDVKNMETDELLDEIGETEAVLEALRAELESRRGAEIIKMRAEMMAQAAALGVSLADVLESGKKHRAPGKPKYRGSAGQTWTGRGKRPGWLKHVADIEQFRIPE